MIRRDEGNASIELVLMAPVLLAILALVVASGRLLSTKSAVEAVTREAARAASGADDAGSAQDIAKQRAEDVSAELMLDSSRLRLETKLGTFGRGTPLTVEVDYLLPLADLPGFGLFPGSIQVSARHTELIERFKSR